MTVPEFNVIVKHRGTIFRTPVARYNPDRASRHPVPLAFQLLHGLHGAFDMGGALEIVTRHDHRYPRGEPLKVLLSL